MDLDDLFWAVVICAIFAVAFIPFSGNNDEFNQGIDKVVEYFSQENHNCKKSDSFKECFRDLQKLKHFKKDSTEPKDDSFNKAIDAVIEYLASPGNKCLQDAPSQELVASESYASFNACFLQLKSMKKK